MQDRMDINTVSVLGATGAVGKTVAGIFASFGNAKVYMVGRDIEKTKKACYEAAKSVKSISIMDNLIPMTFDELEHCVLNSDFIFESVSEEFNLKKNVHIRINKCVNDSAIIATGTSGLSIDDLALCYDENNRERFIGIHFFNPPYSLPLCELIPSKYNINNIDFINQLKSYLTNILIRDVVVVKNEPAFLANRIGFMFMNEALQYAEKYKEYGGIDYIDSILGCYTGRNMRPLETVDFVGLDVHKSIVDNIYINSKENDKDSFTVPSFFQKLVDNGNLGKKRGIGLYKVEDDKRMVYDIVSKEYRDVIRYNFYYVEQAISQFEIGNYKKGFDLIEDDPSLESDICMRFLLKYIVYSLQISKNISTDISACDNAMANGFNWIPPLALAEVLGGEQELHRLCLKYLKNSYDELLSNLPKSKFDYRKYIKAKM